MIKEAFDLKTEMMEYYKENKEFNEKMYELMKKFGNLKKI